MKNSERPEKPEWDDYFMALAYLASTRSSDESTHTGCVVVDDDRIVVATGYNGLPRGVPHEAELQERPEKYYWFEHAERNAIYCASRRGVSLKGCTLYVTGTPCMDCARAIWQAGITRVVIDADFDTLWAGGDRKGEEGKGHKWLEEHGERTFRLFNKVGLLYSYEGFGEIVAPYRWASGRQG